VLFARLAQARVIHCEFFYTPAISLKFAWTRSGHWNKSCDGGREGSAPISWA